MNNERELTFICEECFYKIPVIMKAKYSNLKGIRIDGISGGHLDGTCPNCGKKVFFFSVDKAMGNIVSILHQRKYLTGFSCQGHSYTTFEKNDGANTMHIRYAFDRPYITIESSRTKSKGLLKTFLDADFNEISFCNFYSKEYAKHINESFIIKDNIDDYIEFWERSCEVAIYLDESKIKAQYKKVVSAFEGKKASDNILDKVDEKIDKYFEYKCNQLASLLKKNLDRI